MTIPEKAAAFMEQIADDDAHGYDQGSRWGPDYDCSSLVITAYKEAGVPLTCTFTGNMRVDMLAHGFRALAGEVNTATGAGMERGDVLLNVRHHTAMFVGGGQIVHAAGNERGGATGGKTGDQTGREICRTSYFNFPWDCVLRYAETDSDAGGPEIYTVKKGDYLGLIAAQHGTTIRDLVQLNELDDPNLIFPGQVLLIRSGAPAKDEPDVPGTYTVRPGDTLWGIAAMELGAGFLWRAIYNLNGLTSDKIYPGQVLRLPEV